MKRTQQTTAIILVLFSALTLGLAVFVPSLGTAAPLCRTVFKPAGNRPEFDRTQSYKVLGAQVMDTGTQFAIWAPNARAVEVVIAVDNWQTGRHFLTKDQAKGIWFGFVADAKAGDQYKYRILDSAGKIQFRNDPYAREIVRDEPHGQWNSVISNPGSYHWQTQNFNAPTKMRIMEVNTRTRVPQSPEVNFRDLARHLLPILKNSNINTVSLMPITQHNVVESWGYQPGGIYAVDFRHGRPDDLKYFVDFMHQNGIAVIIDVVLGHASRDWDTGLGNLDGSQLYFPEASHLGEHRDWGTYIYNFGRLEVQDFLISNVKYWAEEFKIDGIRLDGVTSMLYLDYSRSESEKSQIWHEFGTNRNWKAVEFLKKMNSEVKRSFPHFVTIAEESSGWPGVTRPVHAGGLGFDFMWGMGAMHDMRAFLKTDPKGRDLGAIIAPDSWNEKFIYYVNSHDETAHGKQRYIEEINSVSGTDRKFDVARVVTMWMYAMRGRPMLFQGDEIADPRGWSHNIEVQEWLKQYAPHTSFEKYVHDLGWLHEKEPAFDRIDEGSLKVLNVDNANNVLTMVRFGTKEQDTLVIVFNFSADTLSRYNLPVPSEGNWEIVFNSDASYYGGNGTIVKKPFPETRKTKEFSTAVSLQNLPAFSALVLKQR